MVYFVDKGTGPEAHLERRDLSPWLLHALFFVLQKTTIPNKNGRIN